MTLTLLHAARKTAACSFALLSLCVVAAIAQTTPARSAPAERAPVYRVDAAWPKPLPNHWLLGVVVGAAVDRQDHIWILHRPASVPANELQSGAKAAPPVLEFAPDGTLASSWGGPGTGFDWPEAEHGIYVDRHDNVWIAGAGEKDAQVLKFTRQGKFLMQIGHPGQNRGSNDTENLGAPANMVVDEAANELYVADGYVNHRIIVFNAATGAYKRHWGAYGKRPDDNYYIQLGRKPGQHPTNNVTGLPVGPPSPQFDLVHSVRLSKDGLVYACDRSNNRIQVFRKDGTFVQEAFIANDTIGSGSTSDIGFSVDRQQRFAFVEDSTKSKVYILDRKSLKVLSTFGEHGTLPGQLQTAHNMAVNAKGDLFITESGGRRVQKFVQAGTRVPN